MPERVLLVDDDTNLLSGLQRRLADGFELVTAHDGSAGIEQVERAMAAANPFAVVVCDMRMPGLDGLETLGRIRALAPETVRIMLTGNADQKTAVEAINAGAIFRFFCKPCPSEQLKAGLDAACQQYRLVTAERELLEKTLAGSIRVLVDIATMNDSVASGLAARLREWVKLLTAEFRLPHRWQLEVAATLVPIGLVAVPPEVLAKRRAGIPLSGTEEAQYARHPELARGFIAHIPRLARVAEVVALQDRGFDGSGFPLDGPVGNAIPPDARLLKILKDLAEATGGMPLTRAAFTQLERNAARYDPLLLARVGSCLDRMMASQPQSALEIPLAGLKAGQRLISDIRLAGGRLVLAGGTTLTDASIERVQALSRIFSMAGPITIAA